MSTASDTDTLLDAAIARHEARDLDSAECCYRDILRIHPDHAEALNLLGLLLQDRGKAGDSIPLISQALEIEPDFPEALANLARGLNLLGDHGAAMAACERAVALDPDLAEAWQQLGYSYLALDRDQDALAALRKAITGITGDIELHTAAGTIAQRLNDHATAVRAWRSVLREQPDRIDALVNLGASLIHLDQTDEAVRLHRRAVELAPDDATAQGALAVTLSKRFEGPELVSLCEAMLARDPERVEILLLLGIGLVWLGRFKEAKAAYQKALDLRPDYHDARWQLAAMAIDAVPPEEMEAFRTRFNDVSFPVMERIASGFMIAKSLERAGDYDAAFQAFLDANALGYADLKANNKDFDLRKLQTYVDWVRGVFTKTGFGELRQWGNPSELPVFIVGMPRSGTSLVEQIASSHPRVFGAGEREDMLALVARVNRGRKGVPPIHWDKVGIRQETARHIAMLKTLAADADRVIDKLPDNIQLLGQIFVLFPNARVIICRRDLRDVCVSCFTTHFGDNIDWSYDLEDCARRALKLSAWWTTGGRSSRIGCLRSAMRLWSPIWRPKAAA
jgi:tetratricopeptide (TPR) repeat protein